MVNENDERLPRGRRGEKGEKGDRGERGLTDRAAYAIIALFAIAFIVAVIALGWSVANADNARNAADDARQSDIQTRQDFCGIVDAYVATPVPSPSDPASNPSREQAYQWYVRFTVLHRKLGCGRR